MKLRYTLTGTMEIDENTYVPLDDMGIIDTEEELFASDPETYISMMYDNHTLMTDVKKVE